MNSPRNIFLWALYDFANSIILITFFLYFAQWVVVEKGIQDIYYNLTFTAAAILLLLTVPITGFLLDKYWRRITGLRYTTFATALLFLISAIGAIHDNVPVALIFFTLGMYIYLLTFTFYTPLLNDIASPEKIGRISGIGIACNYAGQFAGLLLALPFSNGLVSFFGASSRLETLIPSVIVFVVLTLPTIIWFYEPPRPKAIIHFKTEVKEFGTATKNLFLYPGIALFIITYFLFNDAILTASNNFPIFMEQVWAVSDNVKTYLLLGIIITSGIGGLLGGMVSDRLGHKRTMVLILAVWIVLLPLVGLVTNFTVFIVCAVAMGFWFGASWTVSRSVMSYLIPPGSNNLAFGYFGLIERASSFIGPVVWGSVVGAFVSIGSFRYRLAIVAVTGFIVLGLWTMMKVRSDRITSLK
ncbi:MAG: MFS transporter [Patescibacteria group bacterium]